MSRSRPTGSSTSGEVDSLTAPLDISERKRGEALFAGESVSLMIATGVALEHILNVLVRLSKTTVPARLGFALPLEPMASV
jgi:hypothetical protein